ncbi:MAG TPA: MATE family efflux transporter [Gemmatimonadales bacterium]|nr:MATE family efflux transporter [Gemmatimonadales bacterium]
MTLASRILPRASDVRALLGLGLPVIVVQVGMMAMGVVDTIMVGHLNAQALAAVALGNLYFFGVAIFGMGVLMALDPVVAQAVGAGDHEAAARGVQRGVILAALLCLPASAMLLPAESVLRWANQPAEVVPIAGTYCRVSIPGTFGFFAFIVFRQSLQAMGRLRSIVVAVLIANLVNAALNWVLIYGHLGMPTLGAVGSAWATTLSRWVMSGLLLALGWHELRPVLLPIRPGVGDPRPLTRMFLLGAPIGAQHQLEYGVFGLVGLMMGWLGTTQVAAHQIALNLASITFMVPLGLSSAAAVVVGHAVGRSDPAGARGASRAALACAVTFMGTTALAFMLLPGVLAGFYTSDPAVLALAVLLLPLAGVFQVFDGIQVTSIGILRGLGDTRTPMIIGLLGYWVIGLPVSLWLGFRLARGPVGLWWGLVLGLVIVALFLLDRVRRRLQRPLRRVHIDHVQASTGFSPTDLGTQA